MRGISGPCGLCQRAVSVTFGSPAKLSPYRGAFLFICPACQRAFAHYVLSIHECCMCRKSLPDA
jgi:hypothetical protein